MEDCHEDLKGTVVAVKAFVAKDAQGAFRLVIRRMEAAEECLMADYINGLTDAERSRYTEILWKYINSIKNEATGIWYPPSSRILPDWTSSPHP